MLNETEEKDLKIKDLLAQMKFHMGQHVKYERQSTLLKIALWVAVVVIFAICYTWSQRADEFKRKIMVMETLIRAQEKFYTEPAKELWHDKRDTIKNWKKVDTSLIEHSEMSDAIQDGFRTH